MSVNPKEVVVSGKVCAGAKKNVRKVKLGRVEKGRGGCKEELKSWQRGFSFL